jgi:competence protein ComEC
LRCVSRAPLLAPALALVCGILAERFGLAFLGAGAIALTLVPLGARSQRFALALAFGIGLLDGTLRGHPSVIAHEIESVTLHGLVTGDVVEQSWGRETELTLDDGARLAASFETDVEVGDDVTVRGRIEPFDEPRNPGEPSAREIAGERGLAGRLVAATVLERRPAPFWNAAVALARTRAVAAAIVRKRIPEPDASILSGALWGERGTLPRDLKLEFQETGTVHVLVTAGLHLGVVALLATALGRLLCIPRATAALGTIGIVWVYAALSGAHLPSLRAATMISVALLARACGARAFSWNAFAAAIIAVAALWPAAVGGASFALSFSCVGAILLFADHVAAWCERLRVPGCAAEACALTVATQIGVWPLTAHTFLTVAPYAVVANLAVVPLVGSVMMLGLAQLVTDRLPFLPDTLAALDTGLLDWIVATVHAVSALPGARLQIAPPPPWGIALYDVCALCAVLALARRRFAWAFGAFAFGTIAVLAPTHGPPGTVTITALDVGQGDGIMVRTPRGHTIMIDTGGRLEIGNDEESSAELIGERIVVPYLIRGGIRSVDGIILTHPHGDHVGGCAPILRDLGADWIADSGQTYGGHAFRDCIATARAQRVPIREPRAGDVWRTDDGITLRFLAPSEPYIVDSGDDVNENSIVVMLEYEGFRVLFMGDAGQDSEARLVASGVDLHANVLKVGHHGSAYASTPEFVAAVHPTIAIISVGRHNLFGHPAPSTIATLRAAGIRVYRTDLCGAVTVTPRGTSTMLRCY